MVCRCKFKCTNKTESLAGFQVEMQPVTDGSPENNQFFKYTPYGKLEIGLISEESANNIKVGKEYYLDIIPAE